MTGAAVAQAAPTRRLVSSGARRRTAKSGAQNGGALVGEAACATGCAAPAALSSYRRTLSHPVRHPLRHQGLPPGLAPERGTRSAVAQRSDDPASVAPALRSSATVQVAVERVRALPEPHALHGVTATGGG
jgi:hypothetical protein